MSLVSSVGFSLYSTSFDHNNFGNAQLQLKSNPLNLPSPFDSCKYEPRILGSCEGLLCLSFPECVILWNPSTRTHHVVPSLPCGEERAKEGRYYAVHGLAYDKTNDDFKFIRVHQFVGHPRSEVWVYTLNSDSWKNIGEFPYYPHLGREVTDVFVNGSLHYIVGSKNRGMNEVSEYLIAAFDVSAETYQLIPKPKSVDLDEKVELGVLDGRLCMVLNDNDGNFKLLQMKQYGNELSWVELFRFESGDDGPSLMRPITYLPGNENEKQVVVLEGEGQVYCFDVESDSLKDVHVNNIDEGTFEFVEVYGVYIESQRTLDTVDYRSEVVEECDGHGDDDDDDEATPM